MWRGRRQRLSGVDGGFGSVERLDGVNTVKYRIVGSPQHRCAGWLSLSTMPTAPAPPNSVAAACSSAAGGTRTYNPPINRRNALPEGEGLRHLDFTWQQFPPGLTPLSFELLGRERLGDSAETIARCNLVLQRVVAHLDSVGIELEQVQWTAHPASGERPARVERLGFCPWRATR